MILSKKSFSKINTRQLFLIFAFLFINSLFLLKYVPRTGFSPVFAIGVYLISLFLFAFVLKKRWSRIESIVTYLLSFSTLIISTLSFILLYKIEPMQVDVDRWSALHNFIGFLFKGDYPYLSETHMGQHASPFPVMHLIAMPFYFLGDVGYLQVFSYLASVYAVYRFFGTTKALIFNAILFVSPAWWYEVAVRSDLISNLLFVAVFMVLFSRKKNKSFNSSLHIAIISGLLLCTRGIVLIPLIIFWGLYFKNLNIRNSIIFLIFCGLVFVIPQIPFALWDWALFIKYNPILLQTNKTPFIIQFLAIMSAIYAGCRTIQISGAFYLSALILFGLMLTTFVISLVSKGYNTTMYQHHFDLAYFNVALPFLIFGMMNKNRRIND